MHRYQGTDKMLEKNMEEDRPAEILIFLLKLRDNNSISIRDQRTILFLTIYHGLLSHSYSPVSFNNSDILNSKNGNYGYSRFKSSFLSFFSSRFFLKPFFLLNFNFHKGYRNFFRCGEKSSTPALFRRSLGARGLTWHTIVSTAQLRETGKDSWRPLFTNDLAPE